MTNLTAGVFVFDHRFVLLTANPGAERIFKQPFGAWVGQGLASIVPLSAFDQVVEQAFAEQDASAAAGGAAAHWQKQVEIPLEDEDEPLTLLVRGTRLPGPSVGAHGTERGYVVVFDDISDVISAQRSVAWGEVARRLAHEIKNPLTPIQLSAERLEMKLSPKLSDADAEVLRRGATTIVNQVAAMKRMVDDFRDYARTPPAVLQELDLNALASEVLHLYGIDHPSQHDHPVIEVKLGEGLPLIKGDPTQLRQVIHNLLQNAQDALADQPPADAAPRIAPEFACTVKLARRLYPESPNCKLGTLARYHRLPDNGRAHRALADAMTTAQLVQRMQREQSGHDRALGEPLREPVECE